MSFVAVLPHIYEPWTTDCIDSMSGTFKGYTHVVDNTVTNIGVSASWNEGVDICLASEHDWLVVLSAAMMFCGRRARGGDAFLDELDKHPDAIAIEAGHGVAWHCIAFPRHVFEECGRFDENLSYYGDNDWSRRLSLKYGLDPPYWCKVNDTGIAFQGNAHAIDLGGVRPDNPKLLGYYASKWGSGPGGGESFLTPFNDPGRELSWWPTPPDPRSILTP